MSTSFHTIITNIHQQCLMTHVGMHEELDYSIKNTMYLTLCAQRA